MDGTKSINSNVISPEQEDAKTNVSTKEIALLLIDEDTMKEHKQFIRIFYWAAFYGDFEAIRIMVEVLRWSPMLKSYKGRSILAGAILGE